MIPHSLKLQKQYNVALGKVLLEMLLQGVLRAGLCEGAAAQLTYVPIHNTLTMFLDVSSINSEFHNAILEKYYIFDLMMVNDVEIIDIWETSLDLQWFLSLLKF